MADIKLLQDKRNAIQAELEAYNEEKSVKEEWYHQNSLVRDELDRLIREATEGPKPTEPISVEAVRTAIAASKVKEPIGIKEG